MNKKGFTLIELLAVIVILAIIALIATPIVMNIIEDSKKGAAERSVDNYVKALETSILTSRTGGTSISDGVYTLAEYTTKYGEIEVNGNKPVSTLTTGTGEKLDTTIYIKNGQVATGTTFVVDGYLVNYVDGTGEIKSYDNNKPVGTKIYYNPVTNEKALASVDTDAECTGDCKIFYVLEDKGTDYATVSLIMDRNFTDSTVPSTMAWCIDGGENNTTCENINSTDSTAPLGHIQGLWENVTVSFPSASQVATADGKNYLEYPTLSKTWLYGNSSSSGYWTSSPTTSDPYGAWSVPNNGLMGYDSVDYTGSNYGVRPIITMPKTKIQ